MAPAAWIALCSTRHTGMLHEDKNEEEKNTVQNGMDTQNIIQINDKMKLAQVQAAVRAVGTPPSHTASSFPFDPGACRPAMVTSRKEAELE